MPSMPQHLLNAHAELPRPFRRRLPAVIGTTLLVSQSQCLSVTAPLRPQVKSNMPKQLYESRLVNDLKNTSLESRRNALLSAVSPSLDNEAWLKALFDDDSIQSVSSSDKEKAEEFDKLMETSSEVKDTLRDLEALLKLDAEKRRAANVASISETAVYSPVTASSLLSKGDSSSKSKRGQPVNPLLSKEHEYSLARAIQLGVKVHKLKYEYEFIHGPISKKEWAAIANMETSELRRVVSNYRSAKQELVQSNMGLVHSVARDFSKKTSYNSLTLEELIQEGSLGLIRAAELFDPSKNLRFSTYATIWIKGSIQNSREDEFVKLPYREKKAWSDIQAVLKDLEGEGEKNVSSKEIAHKLGMDEGKVNRIIKKMTSVSNVLSLDYRYSSNSRSGDSNGEKTNEAFLADADLAELTSLKADIVSALVSNLNEKEILLIRLVYGLYDGKEYSIKDSAEIMGMNKETVRLLHKECLRKLREAKDVSSLEEYLLTVA